MERLTYRTVKGEAMGNSSVADIGDILGKLADYEDLEEQGLLLKLPCKVGDTIYELYRDGEYCVSWWDIKEVGFSLSYYERYKDKFGKSVFLTKEEAEQKLKELSK